MNKPILLTVLAFATVFSACKKNENNKPQEGQVPFIEQTAEGVYSLNGKLSSIKHTFDREKNQFLSSGKSSKVIYRAMDFQNSVYLDMDFSGTTFTSGKTISAVICTSGINGLPASNTASLSVVQVEGELIYLSDTANGIGYIITK